MAGNGQVRAAYGRRRLGPRFGLPRSRLICCHHGRGRRSVCSLSSGEGSAFTAHWRVYVQEADVYCTGIKFVLWRTFISICVSCYDSFTDLVDAHQAKVQPMLHVTIALHKGLNGPLTGTGAMEAPGAGASMTLEVDFQTPGQEGTHHMSMPIGELSFSIGFRIWRRRSDLLLCWFSRLFS